MSRAVDLAEQVLDLVGDRAEAEVVASEGNLALTRFANSFIHQNVAELGEAIALRVAVDGRVASTRTTTTSAESLAAFVEVALETAQLQPVDAEWPGLAPPAPTANVEHADDATYDATPGARAELVRAFVDAGNGLLAAGYCQTEGRTEAFVNSAGQSVSGRHTSAIIDGIHQTGTSAGTAHAASVAIGDLDGASVGELAARRAIDSAAPFDTKPGEYEVVLSPEAVATVAVFLGFYGFNGKMLSEGQSFVALGERQFDEQFQMWDDVTDPRALGVPFDTEGTPKSHLDLVVDGTTRGVAHNRKTAKKAGVDDAWFVEDGFVTEGTSNNAYIVKGGKIITRGLSSDILHGITRAAVLRFAAEAQMEVEERSFTMVEAAGADEAFITSASAFVMPVVEVDGVTLGDGKPGRVATRLREIYIAESRKAAV